MNNRKRKIILIILLLSVFTAGVWTERSSAISFLTQFVPPYTTCSGGHFDSVNIVIELSPQVSSELDYDYKQFKKFVEKNLDLVMRDANFPLYSERPDLYQISSMYSRSNSIWENIFPKYKKNALNIVFYFVEVKAVKEGQSPEYLLMFMRAVRGQSINFSFRSLPSIVEQENLELVLRQVMMSGFCFNPQKIMTEKMY